MPLCSSGVCSRYSKDSNSRAVDARLSLPPSVAYKSRKVAAVSRTSASVCACASPSVGGDNNARQMDSPSSVGSTLSSSRRSPFNRTLSERKIFAQTADKLVLVMVGLPARGKSFIANKLCKFLSWKGLKTHIFNVGQLRRTVCTDNQDHTFFDPSNKKAIEARENLAYQSLQQVQHWLLGDEKNSGGDVAIFDATNTTKKRRQMLLATFDQFANQNEISVHVVFIESICTNQAVINANIAEKVSSSPDYAQMRLEDAITDLKRRMSNYEKAYEAVEDAEHLSYIKLFDLQSKVHAHNIYGHVAKSILPYMMSFHIEHRPIWLVRAGHCTEVQSDFRTIAKHPCVASRSAHLSALGNNFSRLLATFVEERTEAVMASRTTCPGSMCYKSRYGVNSLKAGDAGCVEPCLVMTSTLPRAVETAQYLPHDRYEQLATLNPLDKGECYGMSMSEMQEQMPEAYEAFVRDPWKTRFPGGESYFDLMLRVEPILIDIEQHTGPVLLVSHISTLQVLYSYFLGIPIENCSDLEIPFHSVLELIPNQHGWNKTVFCL